MGTGATQSDETTAAPQQIEVFSSWLGMGRPPFQAAKCVLVRQSGGYERRIHPEETVDIINSVVVDALMAALRRPPVSELDASLFPVATAAVMRDYKSCMTDDHPSHLFRLTFAQSHTLTIRTDSQHVFMLPWEVADSRTRTTWTTYDPEVSKAAAALLTPGFPCHGRIWKLR